MLYYQYMELFAQLTVNGLIAGALYTLVALGFNLTYSTGKFFNLAHGTFAVIGVYTVFALTRSLHLPLAIAIGAGITMAACTGFALDQLVFLPLRNRKASNMILLVASLGAFTALQALVAVFFTSQFQTLRKPAWLEHTVTIGSAAITITQILMMGAAILISLATWLYLTYTRVGKAVIAIADDEEVARTIGIPTKKIISGVMALGAGIAGIAGILVGFDTGLEPTMGMGLLLKGVIAAIIGGIGSISGSVLGALLLGLIENYGILKISSEWKDAIAFGVLIIFLLVRPQGMMKR